MQRRSIRLRRENLARTPRHEKAPAIPLEFAGGRRGKGNQPPRTAGLRSGNRTSTARRRSSRATSGRSATARAVAAPGRTWPWSSTPRSVLVADWHVSRQHRPPEDKVCPTPVWSVRDQLSQRLAKRKTAKVPALALNRWWRRRRATPGSAAPGRPGARGRHPHCPLRAVSEPLPTRTRLANFPSSSRQAPMLWLGGTCRRV